MIARWMRAPVDLLTLVLVLLILATPVIAYGVSEADGIAILLLLITQAAVAVGIWAIPYGQKRQSERRRIDARSETRVALGDVLVPLMSELSRIAGTRSKHERQGLAAAMQASVLAAASGLGKRDARTRACYYKFLDEKPARLVYQRSSGRASSPARDEFVEGDPVGDAVIELVREDEYVYSDDVREDPPPGWSRGRRTEYQTLISVAVTAGPNGQKKSYGMLSVDSMEPGDLADEDRYLLHIYGQILATAIEAAE